MHTKNALLEGANRLFRVLLVATFFLVIAVIMTWPLATKLNTHLPDFFNDSMLHSWNSWWVKTALSSKQNPLYTTALFFPEGISLATHNIAWFHVIPSLLLSRFAGVNNIAAYNIAVLLNVALCGCSAFFLAYKLTDDPRAGLISGIIYQAWPYRLFRLDLPNLLATYWIPIFFLFLIYSLQRGRRRDFVLTGICFALIGYTRWQLLIPAAIMGTVFFLANYNYWDIFKRRFVLWGLLQSAVIALLLLSPAITLILLDQSDDQAASLYYEGEETKLSTDLFAFFTPSENHPVFGETTKPLYENYYDDRENTRRRPAYIGFLALGLSVIGVIALKKKSLPWLALLLVIMALALGPVMRINGVLYEGSPTLYGLLSPLKFVRLIRNPERFTMFAALPISILAAYGVSSFLSLKPFQSKSMSYSATFVIGSAILFDFFSPQLTFKNLSQPSEIYAQIAVEEGEFALLNLPFDPLKGSIYMYDQTVHQKGILQGNLSRIPPKAYSYFRDNTFLNSLLYVNEFDPNLGDVSQYLNKLAADNVRYIVIHKTLVGQDRIDHWQRYLLLNPIFEDNRLIVYSTNIQSGQNFILENELYPGIGPISSNNIADCLLPNDIFEVTVGWGTSQNQNESLDAVFELQNSNNQVVQTQRFVLNEEQWKAGTLSWGYYPFRLSESLVSADYTLRFGVAQKDEAPAKWQVADSLFLREFESEGESNSCNLKANNQISSGAVFGEKIRLASYQLEQSSSSLNLSLTWQADQRMTEEYTVFIHVFDPATGAPVAQNDSPPGRTSLPTRFWWPGEPFQDTVTIPLKNIPKGQYGLAIGVYLPATGERLQLKTAADVSVKDGRLILDSIIILD